MEEAAAIAGDLRALEAQIYALETAALSGSSNVVRGWTGFGPGLQAKPVPPRPDERAFSLSSRSSPLGAAAWPAALGAAAAAAGAPSGTAAATAGRAKGGAGGGGAAAAGGGKSSSGKAAAATLPTGGSGSGKKKRPA